MRFAILLAVAIFASAQESADKRAQTAAAESSAPEVDARLHSDVIKLVELDGTRAAIQNNLRQLINQGKNSMLQLCPACDPAYGDEWARRMLARAKVDDFLDVYVQVYEKHFSDDEVQQLIAVQNQIRSSQQPTFPNALKQKLAAQMVSIRSEIVGGTTQVGAKLGGEIGKEIELEHPEYFRKAVSTAEKPPDFVSGASRATVTSAPAPQAGQGAGSIELNAKPGFEDPFGIQESMGYDEILRRFGPPSAKVTSGPGQETLYYSRKDLSVDVAVRNGKVTSVRKSGPAAQAAVKAP
jgi:hypothetical protein